MRKDTLFSLGTRSSSLSLAQTQIIQKKLKQKFSLSSNLVVIKTKNEDLSLSQRKKAGLDKGIFTQDLERALLNKEVDLAVHCLKDMPAMKNPNLPIVAVLPDEWRADVFLSKEACSLDFKNLPQGFIIGTESPRRLAQFTFLAPQCQFLPLRGNVDTRLKKFALSNEYDAILLAEAGLRRLSYDLEFPFKIEGKKIYPLILPEEIFYPAGGQGVLALQMHKKHSLFSQVALLNHQETDLRISLEREILRLLGATCQTAIGFYSQFSDEKIDLQVRLFQEGKLAPLEARVKGKLKHFSLLAQEIVGNLQQ